MPASLLRPSRPGRRAAVPTAALWRYAATVLPCARRELRRWRLRARAIPDPALRAHACATLREEGGNGEGAALLALCAPAARRPDVVRLLVSVQVLYDYLDTLSEQPAADPLAASRRLHAALRAVLPEADAVADWYAGYSWGDDGGYLAALVARCRTLLASLPAHALVIPAAGSAIERASECQSRNHAAMLGALPASALAQWASTLGGRGTRLRWWELAAASGSSLALHALLAAAADPALTAAGAARLEAAYWPWACALNTLLESVADEAADAASGNHCYVRHYDSPAAAAARLGAIAARASAAARALPDAVHHATVLAAMANFYLDAPRGGWTPVVRAAVLPALDPDAHGVRRGCAD